jgi:hypothetical protein
MRAIYTLAAPQEARHMRRITIEVLSPQAAFLALVGNTFNYMIVDPERLQRQVRETTRLVASLPVKKLAYPRGVTYLPAVRDAILADLGDSHSANGHSGQWPSGKGPSGKGPSGKGPSGKGPSGKGKDAEF